MPFNGTGTFTRVYNWSNDKANGINITASRFDTEDSGFATGLSTCITKDGQQTTTALIPFAQGIGINVGLVSTPGLSVIGDASTGFYQTSSGTLSFASEGVLSVTFNANGLDNSNIGQGTPSTAAFTYITLGNTATVGGTANAITLTFPTTTLPVALSAGQIFDFKAASTNTGAVTLQINSLTAKNIYKKGAAGITALIGGEIQSGDMISVVYDGTQFQLYSETSGSFINKINYQKFVSSGTYTPTPGMVYCIIEAWGGGGGGGGIGSTSGVMGASGGGGAGEYSRLISIASTIGTSQTVTVGAAGTGGTAGFNNGTSGTATSVGTLCIANGGSFGNYSSSFAGIGGLGGTGGTGSLVGTAMAGGTAFGASIITVPALGGTGGSTLIGGGGISPIQTTAGAISGNAGTGYGSGGSGAAGLNSSATAAGGSGMPGIVIITEFISA